MTTGAEIDKMADLVDLRLGQAVRCAIEQNLSFHRFALAPDADRYMFNGVTAPTLGEAHSKGCPRCATDE